MLNIFLQTRTTHTKVTISVRVFSAFSFEKQIEGFLISFFIYFQHSILSVIQFIWHPINNNSEMIFQFSDKVGFMAQRVANLHNTLPLDMSIFLENEKNMGGWSVGKAVKISILLIDSCKTFETRK